jgi:diguanylate cyclase (GGDEF)-like protein/PAS domain S-box-containing protein
MEGRLGPRRSRRDGLFWTFAAAGVLIAVFNLAEADTSTARLMGVPCLALLAVVAVVVGCLRWQPEAVRAWTWIAGGLAFLFLGEVGTWVYQRLGSSTFPSMADAFHLAAYPALAAGLLTIAAAHATVRDRLAVLDSSIVAVAAALVLWLVLVEQYTSDASLTTLQKTFSIAYPGADVLLLALTVRLLFSVTTRSASIIMLFAGLAAMLVGDTLFALDGVHTGSGATGSIQGWILAAYLLLGLAGLHRSMAQPAQPPTGAVTVRSYRLVLLVLAAIVPPALAVAHELGWWHQRDAVLAVAVAGIVVSTLVLVRMWGLSSFVRVLAEQRGQDRFQRMIQHSQDVIAVVNAAGRLDYVSPAASAQWGWEPEDVTGGDLADYVFADDIGLLREHLSVTAALAPAATYEFEVRLRRRDNVVRFLDVVATNLLTDGNVGGIVLTMRDATDQKTLERQLAHQAFHDSLTGLANRALFFDRVEHAVTRHRRDLVGKVAVLFVDLDDFKAVNDGLGHGFGDDLLIAVGERLRECLRPGDTAARLGGDEFAVLLEEAADLPAARAVAQRMLEVLLLPASVGELEIAVPASIGIAVAEADATTEDLLRDADIAMYTAKAAGKGQYAVFNRTMREHATRRLEFRTELSGALDRGELRLDYQPIVDVATGRIVSVEALLRWHHPERGVIPPLDFIPFAEESGLIIPIGRWVIEAACREAAGWQRLGGGPIKVAVNVSGSQLGDPELVDHVRAALADTGLPPECLVLELTETVLMEDTQHTIRLLEELKQVGVRISIDDFGTGYCSLAYLRRFPVDDVKIDRAFIEELGRIPTSATLASNILTLTEALGVGAVAEGVETEEQLEILRHLDCELAQGFYLARPLDPQAVRRLIAQGSEVLAPSVPGTLSVS